MALEKEERIIELQQSCYGKKAKPWHGANLLAAMQAVHNKHDKNANSQALAINP